MRKFLAALLIEALLLQPCLAAYVGPGDITTFTAWYGLRAYSAAVAATGTQKAVDLVRNDAATCTAIIATSGSVDLTVGTPCNGNSQTVTQWNAAGATGTCSISIAGTVMTRNSCSAGNIHQGDSVTCGSCAAGTYVINIGNCTIDTLTCNVTPSQTVGTTTATLAPDGIQVAKIYDQTGGNACGAASCDAVQATLVSRPLLFLNGCGLSSLPCIVSQGDSMGLASANNFTGNATLSMAAVGKRDIGTGGGNFLQTGSSGVNSILSNGSVSNSLLLEGASGSVASTAADGSWHALNGSVITGSNTSTFNVDGTATTGTTGGANTAAAKIVVAVNASGSPLLIGLGEAGFADNTTWGTTTLAALCANEGAYWDVTVTCSGFTGGLIPRAPLTHW